MICYRKTDGRAHDLRIVSEDYVAEAGEILLEGDELPDIETLHDEPSPTQVHNESIDAQVEALYLANPHTNRSHDEVAWAIAELRDIRAVQCENLERVVRALAAGQTTYVEALACVRDANGVHVKSGGRFTFTDGSTKNLSTFAMAQEPDLKKNKGMKDAKARIDATAVLRAQKLP